MSLLSTSKIREEIELGHIKIEPYDPDLCQNGISIDVRLGEKILVWSRCGEPLDPDNFSDGFENLPQAGSDFWILNPGKFYLAHTLETIGSDKYAPILAGKSTLARCSLVIHQTAGIIEPGFYGQITLELNCTEPVILRPGMKIGQVLFETVVGEIEQYQGRYQNQTGPTTARGET